MVVFSYLKCIYCQNEEILNNNEIKTKKCIKCKYKEEDITCLLNYSLINSRNYRIKNIQIDRLKIAFFDYIPIKRLKIIYYLYHTYNVYNTEINLGKNQKNVCSEQLEFLGYISI